MKLIIRKLILIAGLLFLFQLLIQPVLADAEITVDYFYSSGCGTCRTNKEHIREVEENL